MSKRVAFIQIHTDLYKSSNIDLVTVKTSARPLNGTRNSGGE